MKEDTKKISFHIIHKGGTELRIEDKNPNELIKNTFSNREKMKEKVSKLVWKIKSTLCIYDPENGEIERQLSDEDVNPYGWRMKHS